MLEPSCIMLCQQFLDRQLLYASYTSNIMLILCSVMYFDLKHMLVALVLPVLT